MHQRGSHTYVPCMRGAPLLPPALQVGLRLLARPLLLTIPTPLLLILVRIGRGAAGEVRDLVWGRVRRVSHTHNQTNPQPTQRTQRTRWSIDPFLML